jgi:hypothetical protein
MMKIRGLAAIAAAVVVAMQASASDAAAQLRPGMGGPRTDAAKPFRIYAALGYAQLDVDGLNARLAALDEPYSPVSEDLVTFGVGAHVRLSRLLLGGELGVGVSVEEAESGDERRAELSTFTGGVLVGFSILQTDGFDFYPLVQGGGVGTTLLVKERGDPAWDEVLGDPGRESSLSTAALWGAAGVGMDYAFRGGFFMGLRGTYGWTGDADDWSDETGEVLGGPAMNMTGPSVRLLIGYGRR